MATQSRLVSHCIILISLCIFLFPPAANSVVLTSENYQNRLNVFSSGGGIRSSASYVQEDTVGQETSLSEAVSPSFVNLPGFWPAVGGQSVAFVDSDWDGDGKPDVLWRNYSTGENYIWFMDGPTRTGGTSLPSAAVDWVIQSAADFNYDGNPDILWRNFTSGDNYIWYMHGSVVLGGAPVMRVDSLNWGVAAAADFSGDGKPDLLWRNYSTGGIYIWYLNENIVTGADTIAVSVETGWNIVGARDFNEDSRTDLLWRHTSGENYLWYMDGTTFVGGESLPGAGINWEVDGTADFNRDGRPDICWRNYTSGENYLWYMEGAVYSGGDLLPRVNNANWHIEE